eukprot:SAG11_NODE_863_length_6839_cov_4.857418_1_plen_85_part_00
MQQTTLAMSAAPSDYDRILASLRENDLDVLREEGVGCVEISNPDMYSQERIPLYLIPETVPGWEDAFDGRCTPIPRNDVVQFYL